MHTTALLLGVRLQTNVCPRFMDSPQCASHSVQANVFAPENVKRSATSFLQVALFLPGRQPRRDVLQQVW